MNLAAQRFQDEHHIQHIPAGELLEHCQIFAAKGFAGETLERIVQTITADRPLWRSSLETLLMGAAAAALAYFVRAGLRAIVGNSGEALGEKSL